MNVWTRFQTSRREQRENFRKLLQLFGQILKHCDSRNRNAAVVSIAVFDTVILLLSTTIL